ncbi:MAG: hypothetical protein K0R29_2922, partial [Pseudobdellovibrio sp.]|nr:hypothetical protein [Pseudobdellovibrio sp.]
DKKALRASLTEILKWDFDRMVMAHGKVIESGAKEIFINAAKERGLLE